jgi:hypothetical protein
MRPSLTACRTGLSVAAAVVLLTACGGSDDTASSASSKAGSSASESSAADSKFCTEAAAIQKNLGTTLEDSQDPTALPQALQEAAAQIRAIDPPAEIADDWNRLADGAEKISQAFASIDINDPNALATLEQKIGELGTGLSTASTRVDNYLREKCGIDTGSTDSAAPSS